MAVEFSKTVKITASLERSGTEMDAARILDDLFTQMEQGSETFPQFSNVRFRVETP